MNDQNGEIYKKFLQWRNIDTPCVSCGGSGVKMYGNTTTWRGGIGGQIMTSDVCDVCWGSGDADRHWINLRTVRIDLEKRKTEEICKLYRQYYL